MARRVWFQLVDPRGHALLRKTSVEVADDDVIDVFMEAVKAKCAMQLAHTDAPSLLVFESTNLDTPLDPDAVVTGRLGGTSVDPLIVRVPAISQASVSVSLPSTEPLVDESPSKRQARYRVEWHVEPTPCPQLDIKDNEQFVCIPRHYVSDSGLDLSASAKDLWLYRRFALREEWNEIYRDCIDTHARLWIVGAPGTGKSCAAYAFACGKVDRREWDVLWLHAPVECKQRRLLAVKFQGDVKSTCKIPLLAPYDEIDSVLASFTSSSQKLIVFLDGYVESEPCVHAWTQLGFWQENDPTSRRLVNVTSMVAFGKDYKPSRFQEIGVRGAKHSRQNGNVKMRVVMMFKLASWTLTEYKAAIQHDSFVRSVETALRPLANSEHPLPANTPLDEREQLVLDKYFVAGGSARMMFSDESEDAIRDIEEAIKAVSESRH